VRGFVYLLIHGVTRSVHSLRTTVGSSHLSYCQALEQGFQGCLGTTRADLGSGPPACWARQTGYGPAEPAPARRCAHAAEPASDEALGASLLRRADQRRGPGRGRIRCMENGVSNETWGEALPAPDPRSLPREARSLEELP